MNGKNGLYAKCAGLGIIVLGLAFGFGYKVFTGLPRAEALTIFVGIEYYERDIDRLHAKLDAQGDDIREIREIVIRMERDR